LNTFDINQVKVTAGYKTKKEKLYAKLILFAIRPTAHLTFFLSAA
jgi:hypothetical protein